MHFRFSLHERSWVVSQTPPTQSTTRWMLNAENFSVTHEQHDEDSTRLWCKLLVFAFIFVVWKVERFAWDLRSSTHFSRAQVSFTIMSYSLSFCFVQLQEYSGVWRCNVDCGKLRSFVQQSLSQEHYAESNRLRCWTLRMFITCNIINTADETSLTFKLAQLLREQARAEPRAHADVLVVQRNIIFIWEIVEFSMSKQQ